MDRRSFFKKLGIGTAMMVAVPFVIGKEEELEPKPQSIWDEPVRTGAGLINQVDDKRNYVMYTGKLGMEEFDRLMKQIINNSL